MMTWILCEVCLEHGPAEGRTIVHRLEVVSDNHFGTGKQTMCEHHAVAYRELVRRDKAKRRPIVKRVALVEVQG